MIFAADTMSALAGGLVGAAFGLTCAYSSYAARRLDQVRAARQLVEDHYAGLKHLIASPHATPGLKLFMLDFSDSTETEACAVGMAALAERHRGTVTAEMEEESAWLFRDLALLRDLDPEAAESCDKAMRAGTLGMFLRSSKTAYRFNRLVRSTSSSKDQIDLAESVVSRAQRGLSGSTSSLVPAC